MNRQWLYAKQPVGKIGTDTFQWTETAIPVPRDGEVLVRTRMLSLDPANRAWMMGKTYRDALEPGQVMSGFTIGEVVESKAPGLCQGRHRRGRLGLAGLCRPAGTSPHQAHDQRAAGAADRAAQRHRAHRLFRPAGSRPAQAGRHRAGVGGGRCGRLDGRARSPRSPAAASSARPGGQDKCDWLVRELGFDAAVDYKAGGVFRALRGGVRPTASTSISTIPAGRCSTPRCR